MLVVEVDAAKRAACRARAEAAAVVGAREADKVLAVGRKGRGVDAERRLELMALLELVHLVAADARGVGACAEEDLALVSVPISHHRCRHLGRCLAWRGEGIGSHGMRLTPPTARFSTGEAPTAVADATTAVTNEKILILSDYAVPACTVLTGRSTMYHAKLVAAADAVS